MAHARMSGAEARDVDEPHKFRRGAAQSPANSPYEAASRRN